jgi:chorismate--pyruvate lyase
MRSEDAPIWRNLAAQRTEAYRDLCSVYLGDSPGLADKFGSAGPFWGRHYVLYVGGAPLTVVYEVFAPRLARWLGDKDGRAGAAEAAALLQRTAV